MFMVRCDINLVFWHVITLQHGWREGGEKIPCASNRGSLIKPVRARLRESAAKHSARIGSEGYGSVCVSDLSVSS